ncbi:hypothetical protein [Mesorhizobium sp. M0676]|uniref:hypothetical protein n=1 Tax=Mesorhizobium sp. M0676 TaxID=2956984 RepID=UPI0033391288
MTTFGWIGITGYPASTTDDQTGWSLDGDRQFGRRRHALEPGYHVGQPSSIVADIETDDDLADAVNNAQGMAYAAQSKPA